MHTFQAELEKLQEQNGALQQEIVGVRQQLETEQEEIKIEKTKIQAQRAARGSKEMELRSKIIACTIGKWTNQALAWAVSLWMQRTLENRLLRCFYVCTREEIECARVYVFYIHTHIHTYAYSSYI
jgi:FtsZ-binding cell division protein ZapB